MHKLQQSGFLSAALRHLLLGYDFDNILTFGAISFFFTYGLKFANPVPWGSPLLTLQLADKANTQAEACSAKRPTCTQYSLANRVPQPDRTLNLPSKLRRRV